MSEHLSPEDREAVGRVRAYADAVPALYDDDNPMPEGLTLDTATAWSDPPTGRDPAHDLTYADLLTLLDLAARLADVNARLAAIGAEHVPTGLARMVCRTCWDDRTMSHVSWPCPTAAALHPDPSEAP